MRPRASEVGLPVTVACDSPYPRPAPARQTRVAGDWHFIVNKTISAYTEEARELR
jgi:hypothetical protein